MNQCAADVLVRWLDREGFDLSPADAAEWLEPFDDDPNDAFNEFMACNAHIDDRAEARVYG
jgi:hypothetical protein